MQIDTAKRAAVLADNVEKMSALVAALSAFIGEQATFSGAVSVNSPSQGNVSSLVPQMTWEESNTIWPAVLAVYQARLAAAQAALAAL